MISAIRPVLGQTLPVPALCLMLSDGAARFGRRTPEPHVWPAAPSALARGDGWRGAAVMTDESIKAHLKRGDWVTLDEAFPELVPSDRKEEIKAAIADAASYGGVSAIARQVRDARIAEQARQHGSNVPPSPVRMIFTVDAAKRNAIVDRFQKAWSAIDAAVKKRLADNEWQVERIMPDGSVQSIVSLAWHNMRFRWHGEREFTEQFPGAWVCLPDDSRRRVGCKLPLTMFQVRRASAPNAAPPTVCTTQNSPAPDAETSEAPSQKPKKQSRFKGGGYSRKDAPLIQEMKSLLEQGKASSVWDAAQQVADRAAGGGEDISKVKRLTGRFNETFPDFSATE
ncbi:MAG: hypothetical protein ABF876_16320 [Acetobacter aceti]